MPIQEGGAFMKWNDSQGNPLHSINRDGTHSTQGVNYPDGTSQTTAAVGVTEEFVTAAVLVETTRAEAAEAALAGATIQHRRVSFGTIGSALISLPITIHWTTPFADNNYTVVAQAVIGEATSDGAVTSIIDVASVELIAGGVGVIVTAANADSIPHSVTVHLMAIHD